MIKNKNNIPNIRFSGFNDEWEDNILGEVTQITMGQSPNGENYTDNPNDFILVQGNADIKNNRVVPRVWTTQVTKKAEKGDLILSIRAPVGDIGKTDYDVVIGRGVASIKGNEFIYQLLGKMKQNKYWTKLSTGTTFESIDSNSIKNAHVLTANSKEQEKIGNFFKNIDNLINLKQQKYEKTLNIKKAMLEKMFPKDNMKQPEIRFSGFSGDWGKQKLGKCGKTFTGLSGKTKEDFGHGNAKFITYMNVFSNAISNYKGTDNVEIDIKQNIVKYGDVLFTTSSETQHEVGMSSVWLYNNKNTYLNSFCFGYRPNIEFCPYYLAFMLRSKLVRNEIIFLAQGISRYNISKNKMMDIAIPTPDIKEQEKIGKLFKNIENLINLQKKELEKLKNIKKALLEKMFV